MVLKEIQDGSIQSFHTEQTCPERNLLWQKKT